MRAINDGSIRSTASSTAHLQARNTLVPKDVISIPAARNTSADAVSPIQTESTNTGTCLITDLPDDLLRKIYSHLSYNDVGRIGMFGASSALRERDVVLTCAYPAIYRRILSSTKIKDSDRSKYFVLYASKLANVAEESRLIALTHFMHRAAKLNPAVFEQVLSDVGRVRGELTPYYLEHKTTPEIVAVRNIPLESRARRLHEKLDLVKNLDTERIIEVFDTCPPHESMVTSERAHFLTTIINRIHETAEGEQANLLHRSYDLLRSIRDEDFSYSFRQSLIVQDRIPQKQLASFNSLNIKNLLRLTTVEKSEKVLASAFLHSMRILVRSGDKDIVTAYRELMHLMSCINDDRTLCDLVIDCAKFAIHLSTDHDKINTLVASYIPLEKRSIPKDYNVRYLIAYIIKYLPAHLRYTAETRVSEYLPIMTADGLHKTPASLQERLHGLDEDEARSRFWQHLCEFFDQQKSMIPEDGVLTYPRSPS